MSEIFRFTLDAPAMFLDYTKTYPDDEVYKDEGEYLVEMIPCPIHNKFGQGKNWYIFLNSSVGASVDWFRQKGKVVKLGESDESREV